MAVDIRFIIDGQDRGQPLNPEEFGVTVNEDESITARVVSFDADLIFGGDVYSYLFQKLTDSGYCELVNVRVDYLCGKIWQKLVDGYIIVTESKFNYDKCQVSTKIYDQTFSTRINNNKSIPFSMNLTETKNGQPVTPPVKRRLRLFNPAQPNVYGGAGVGVSVYDALKHLVSCMSDGLVDFDSSFFATFPGDADMDVLTNGRNIRTDVETEIVVTFEELFLALRSKFNLGLGFEVQPNGRPLLRIEQESYFFQSTPSANLFDQSGIEMSFDTARLYASVQFGNDPVLEQNECGDGTQPCTFAQTPFRGFRNESFGFVGECNTANVLNLETSRFVFDTNVIEDVYRFGSNSYENDNFIIQCIFVAATTPRFEAKPTDPYGFGQSVYNGRYTNLNVSNNWLSGFPNTLASFLEPFNTANTIFSSSNNDNQDFDITFPEFTGFLEFTGNHVRFDIENQDIGGNYNGVDTYTVPFAGIYTFTSRIISELQATQSGTRTGYVTIMHYDLNDNLITQYLGSFFTEDNIDPILATVTASFVCNEGDLIRVNYYMKFNSPGPDQTERILPSITIDGVPFDTNFLGDGENLLSPDLEPVNINEVRAYLYKFNRPLSMDEISSILSNTSNPITIGRRNDPLSVIPTYIKSMNIASILRKNAEFTLKSNRLLQ